MYQISGVCNRCGQCCGAPGSPNRDSPWPNNWPEAIQSWDDLALDQIPVLKHVKNLIALESGASFSVRLGNTTYRGIFVPGHGMCKDAAPFGDTSAYLEECPFLKAQVAGAYPCGLVGTLYEDVYTIQCAPMGEFWSDASVAEWQSNHPLCSYVFTEV